ncbi:WD repeat-containing protein 63-like [Scleropages formosus]|uniref:WD repeat-containing protein 63-like n=1 Tax=Scleropages formosus TaxID=113540 RepID=A0A0P7X2Y1_SCLFO|nr:WD repeat-containing protein 63-like [Scleropages formosus]
MTQIALSAIMVAQRPKSTSSGKSSKGGEKAKGPDPSLSHTDVLPDVPEDIFPMVLTSATQELFECRADEDVTQNNPYKLLKKDDILHDMKARAAVSDFHPVKQTVLNYPGEELLLVFDRDFKYGQSFYLVLTEEAKQRILQPPVSTDEEEPEEESEQYVCRTPEPQQPWVSLGSELEIEEESVKDTRERLKYLVSRVRKKFGAPVNFTDRNALESKEGYIECTSYQDRNFRLIQMERNSATQAVLNLKSSATQTQRTFPRNMYTQYKPRELTEEEKENYMSSENLKNFASSAFSRFEIAIQQNKIMDVFFDDWQALSEGDIAFGGKADTYLKEYQSFTDLQFSKDKSISCIKWHPTISGEAATLHLQPKKTCAFHPSTELRPSFNCVRSVIAVSVTEKMSFEERINGSTKLLLNPPLILFWSFSDPINPQIEPLGNLRLECPDDVLSFDFCPSDPNIIIGGCMNGQMAFEEDKENEIPVLLYCAVSSIENGHKAPVTDVQWLPENFEAERKQKMEEKQLENPRGIPNTFKYLDLSWKPLIKDGELVYTSWKLGKDDDSGRLLSGKPSRCFIVHDSLVNTVKRSPFFKDIILTVGGWNFAVWKESVMNGPIILSPCSQKRCMVGCWSLSNPGMFFIGKEDGNIEVWDLLEKTHEPSHIQNISTASITCMKPWIISSKQHFLAVSDDFGTLHILQIPWTLRNPSSSESSVNKYFEKEVTRLMFFDKRKETMAKQKTATEAEEQKKKTKIISVIHPAPRKRQ